VGPTSFVQAVSLSGLGVERVKFMLAIMDWIVFDFRYFFLIGCGKINVHGGPVQVSQVFVITASNIYRFSLLQSPVDLQYSDH